MLSITQTVMLQSWINNIPDVIDMCGVDEYCIIATMSSLIISNQQGIQCDGTYNDITPLFLVGGLSSENEYLF